MLAKTVWINLCVVDYSFRDFSLRGALVTMVWSTSCEPEETGNDLPHHSQVTESIDEAAAKSSTKQLGAPPFYERLPPRCPKLPSSLPSLPSALHPPAHNTNPLIRIRPVERPPCSRPPTSRRRYRVHRIQPNSPSVPVLLPVTRPHFLTPDRKLTHGERKDSTGE